MTTYTTFQVGGTIGSPNSFNSTGRGMQKVQFDVAKFVSTNAFVAGDVEKVLIIPARSVLKIEAIYNDTALALGGTPVFSVGDSASATGWVNASTNIAINVSHTLARSTKTYDTADFLQILLNNSTGTVATGKFTIVYEIIECSAGTISKPTF